ncbi:hypothetical protein ROLI_007780 [Roseobacter fucihabitans]|uniref:Uncharacterized protein n=1 Tax=Roseobacter fucihabitans TaxID=1537242 RepID=A0ABZ2BNX3_9RHOB|nr:hypothetical protein [Roseobacter litoralis]MBC6966054.1 hypothetical protein [Roseobacter litoralis]
MNVVEGLTAASLALGLVKDLRDIDRSVDEAEYKLKIAEIIKALADAKIALSDAKMKISNLENTLAGKSHGDICPICKSGRLLVLNVERHEIYPGIEFHISKCSDETCMYSNERTFDANIGEYKGQG